MTRSVAGILDRKGRSNTWHVVIVENSMGNANFVEVQNTLEVILVVVEDKEGLEGRKECIETRIIKKPKSNEAQKSSAHKNKHE